VNDRADAPQSPADAPTPAPQSEVEEFLTGPRPSKPEPIPNEDRFPAKPAPRKKATPKKPIPVAEVAVTTFEPEAPVEADADLDAVDLYALGAVDYVETA
jgi:hypothetical protein